MKTLGRKVATAQKSRKRKAFAEFFAGIGLAGEALRRSGWICEYANDIDEKKRQVYEANFLDADKYYRHDIWHTETVVSRLNSAPVLAVSTFPCTDLSLAGHWRGFAGTQSSTFFGFIEVLRQLGTNSPRLVLLENVPGFLTARGGADFRKATTSLAELGYWIDCFALDAKAFVPQSRQRIFLLCARDDVRSKLLLRDTAPSWRDRVLTADSPRTAPIRHFMLNHGLATGWMASPIIKPPQKNYSLLQFIDTGDDQRWWKESEVEKHYRSMSIRHRKRIDAVLDEGGVLLATAFRRMRCGKSRLEVRFDGVAGCLRTPRGGSARQIVVYAKSGNVRIRWMSAIEYARLQGARRFRMLENERQMLFGFGDAVCVPVIEWIDKCVLTPVYDECLRQLRR